MSARRGVVGPGGGAQSQMEHGAHTGHRNNETIAIEALVLKNRQFLSRGCTLCVFPRRLSVIESAVYNSAYAAVYSEVHLPDEKPDTNTSTLQSFSLFVTLSYSECCRHWRVGGFHYQRFQILHSDY